MKDLKKFYVTVGKEDIKMFSACVNKTSAKMLIGSTGDSSVKLYLVPGDKVSLVKEETIAEYNVSDYDTVIDRTLGEAAGFEVIEQKEFIRNLADKLSADYEVNIADISETIKTFKTFISNKASEINTDVQDTDTSDIENVEVSDNADVQDTGTFDVKNDDVSDNADVQAADAENSVTADEEKPDDNNDDGLSTIEKYIADTGRRHKDAIEYSINNTLEYIYDDSDDVSFPRITTGTTKITVLKKGVTDIIHAVCPDSDDNKTAVLDFANATYPGGGFTRGSMSQEAALCRNSFLYNVLSSDEVKEMYYRKNKGCGPLGYNRGLFVPDVQFFKDGKIDAVTNVIVVAAPIYPLAKANGLGGYVNKIALQERIKLVLEIAAKNKIETLILGAFGSGVYGQDTEMVAEIFTKELIGKYYNVFKEVIFAVSERDKAEIFWSNVNAYQLTLSYS